jgi:hypothetical protein
MTTTEQATKTLNELQDTREQLVARAAKLASERQKLSYSAHTGDKASKEKLRRINDESVLFNTELESIDAAIAEATSRLSAAQHHEAIAADRAQAELLKQHLAKFIELGMIVDDCFADLLSASTEMKETLLKMHQAGCPRPTYDSFRVNALNALKACVMQIPWAEREWEFLPPHLRKSFAKLVAEWAVPIEHNISARLGAQTKEEKAA